MLYPEQYFSWFGCNKIKFFKKSNEILKHLEIIADKFSTKKDCSAL